jgi:hypothetical protein
MYVNDTPQAIGVHLAPFADDICLYATERRTSVCTQLSGEMF